MDRTQEGPEPDLFDTQDSDDEAPQPASRRDGKERRRNRKVFVAALVLLLVPVLAVGGYLVWLNQIVTSNVKQATLLPDTGPDAQPTDKAGNPVAPPAGNGTNYLLIGNDARPGDTPARHATHFRGGRLSPPDTPRAMARPASSTSRP